jgi:hypothetical protein
MRWNTCRGLIGCMQGIKPLTSPHGERLACHENKTKYGKKWCVHINWGGSLTLEEQN